MKKNRKTERRKEKKKDENKDVIITESRDTMRSTWSSAKKFHIVRIANNVDKLKKEFALF
jgi:hypothetical protein